VNTDNKTDKIHNYDESLQKVAIGASVVFIALFLSLIPNLIAKLIIIRFWTESDYGIFSLAFVFFNVGVIISGLGLIQGSTRSIAYARGKKEYKKINNLISASIWLSTIVSIISVIFIIFFADYIANNFFNTPELTTPLRLISLSIPFFTLINIISSIFRGFDQIKPTVYFQYLLTNLLFPVLLIIVVIFSPIFVNIFYAFILSMVVPCLAFIFYSSKHISSIKTLFSVKSFLSPTTKEILIFSLPLLGTAALNLIISWTDTLMLGSLKTSFDVGLYNAAHPLARMVSFPLTALLYIFMPVFSGLYANGKLDEMRRNFIILTKWLCSATLPLFIILFLFSEEITTILFGKSYVLSANVLRVVSLAFMINNFAGPSGSTLVVLGKPRFIMYATLSAAIFNIFLNILLIPTYGITGAAIASGVAIVTINLIKNWKLYSLSKVQPISKNLLKPTFLLIIITVPIYLISKAFLPINWLVILFLFILFYLIFFASMIFSNSIDQEDLRMLVSLEKRTGVKLNFIKKIITKFS